MRHGGTDRLYERRLTASIANHTQTDVAAGDNDVGCTNMTGRVSCILIHKTFIYRTEYTMDKLSASIISGACLSVCRQLSVQWQW
jgi:hypothetical protein